MRTGQGEWPAELRRPTTLTRAKTTAKFAKKARFSLDASYAYLGGNAVGRDKKGRPTKEDAALSSDMAVAGQTGENGEYSAYVCYEFEVN